MHFLYQTNFFISVFTLNFTRSSAQVKKKPFLMRLHDVGFNYLWLGTIHLPDVSGTSGPKSVTKKHSFSIGWAQVQLWVWCKKEHYALEQNRTAAIQIIIYHSMLISSLTGTWTWTDLRFQRIHKLCLYFMQSIWIHSCGMNQKNLSLPGSLTQKAKSPSLSIFYPLELVSIASK